MKLFKVLEEVLEQKTPNNQDRKWQTSYLLIDICQKFLSDSRITQLSTLWNLTQNCFGAWGLKNS